MSAPTIQAPTHRPARDFGTAKAQRWILATAIVVAMTYFLRRIVEPAVSDAPAKGTKTGRLAGAGSPPPALGHWAVAYGTGFMLLALIALPAPELSASIAILVLTGTVLTNGISLMADLGLLGAQPGTELNFVGPVVSRSPDGTKHVITGNARVPG